MVACLGNASVYTMIDDAGALANNYTLYFVKLILSKTWNGSGKSLAAGNLYNTETEILYIHTIHPLWRIS